MTPPSKRRWSRLHLGLVVASVAMLGACADDAPKDSLDPAGPYARDIDQLFMWTIYVSAAVFVLVNVLLAVAIVSGRRRRRQDPEALPDQVHGNTRLEIGWTLVPALILAAFAVPTVAVLFDLNEDPEDAIEVNVIGQRWWWEFQYPDAPYQGSDVPVTTANEIHIPAGRPVVLRIESRDIIHSFWAPRLNGKRDAVPGRIHSWNLQADEPGRYAGQCMEYCGDSHANMQFIVVAHEEGDYEDWLAGQQALPEALLEEGETPEAGDLAAEGYELFASRACATCHQVDGVYEAVEPASPPAPNLTHLFSRECFAGCMFELTRPNLEAWLRNPPGLKPGSLMPNLALTEADIDRLYAYLETLE